MSALTHALLRDYSDSFRCFGDLDNKIWFLDLEEGGGRSLEKAASKIVSWHEAGRTDVSYLSGPGADTQSGSDYLPKPSAQAKPGVQAKLHKTWSNQLRVLLGIQGAPLSNDAVRELQVAQHGTAGGPTCLLELFPLPCKNAGSWVYDQVPFDDAVANNDFASRQGYYTAYLPRRIEKLKALIDTHKPEALVCMTWADRDALIPLLDSVEEIDLGMPKCTGNAIIGKRGSTVVVICTHPATRFRGSNNHFYHEIGNAIRRQMEAK